MCTLAVAFQVDPRWPLLAAANRDERLDRPAEDWALRAGGGPAPYLSPRDLVGGGTWIGLNARRVFAGITNYHVPGSAGPDPARRTRGEIVAQALGRRSAAEARAHFAQAEAALFNPFHLLVADPEEAFLWWYDGETSALESLGSGLHVVTENSPFGRCPRGDWLRGHWPLDPTAARLRELLSAHGPDPFSRTCIHLDPRYGTRSSAILRLAGSLENSDLYATGGPPCTTPLEDRSELLRSLARSA